MCKQDFKKRGRPALPLAFIVFLGIFACSYALSMKQYQEIFEEDYHPQFINCRTIRITSDVLSNRGALSSFAYIGNEKVVVYWPYGTTISQAPQFGQYVSITGSMQAINPGPYARYLVSQGITSKLNVKRSGKCSWKSDPVSRILKLRSSLIAEICSENDAESHLAAAILFGNKSTLTSQTDAFRAAGLSHMLSVSGSHFALALVMLEILLKGLKLSRKIHLLCCVFFALCFVCMTGMAPSAIRAVIMLSFVELSWFFKRRTSLLATLSICGLVMLIFSPYLALSIGFQLSFAAVFGIALFLKMFRSLIEALPWALPDFMKDNITLSFSAVLGTLPLTILSFSLANPLSFISSLVTTCIFSVIMFLGLAYVIAWPLVPVLGGALEYLIRVVTRLLLECVMYLGDVPGMVIEFGSHAKVCAGIVLVCEIALYYWYPLPGANKRQTELRLFRMKDVYTNRIAVVSLAAFFLIGLVMSPYGHYVRSSRHSTDGYYFLNVGQGDATLIKENDTVFLIDAGPDSVALLNALRKVGVTKIDYLLFTHAHADHLEGAKGLSRSYKIRKIFVARGCERDAAVCEVARRVNAPIQAVLAGDVLSQGSFSISVVWPRAPVIDADDNDSCLMVDVKHINEQGVPKNVLITGDCEKDAVLAACEMNNLELLDVLKLGHHGSKNSLDTDILTQVKVGRIIISVGDNSYGHPRQEVLRLINRFRIPFQRTDESGTIFVPSMAQ